VETEQKLSDKVLKIKNILEENKDWKIVEVQNFYNNVNNNKDITDFEREYLADICLKIIKERFPPKKSRRILNSKSTEAKVLLEEIWNIISKEYDWSKSTVKLGVKPSGHMIGGKIYVGWYISYKNGVTKTNTGIGYIQEKEESEPYLKVDYRELKNDLNESKTFPVQLKDDALILYRGYLTKVINNN